ncbi:hypothetical protein ACTXT7_004372 [Hymenolepis weldensis]
MINFYHRLLPNSAAVIFPLTELLKSTKANFSFSSEAVAAFEVVKTAQRLLCNDVSYVNGTNNILADFLSQTDVEAVTKALILKLKKTDPELKEF